MSSVDQFRQAYLDECVELLEELETGLTALADGETSRDTVDAVFRAVHSIKGGAGMFGLEDLVRFAHRFETTLDALRDGTISLDSEIARLFLRSADLLASYVDATRSDSPLPLEQGAEVVALLEAVLSGGGAAAPGGSAANEAAADEEGDGFGIFAEGEESEPEEQGFGIFDEEPGDQVSKEAGDEIDDGWGLFAETASSRAADAPPAGKAAPQAAAAKATPKAAAGAASIRVDLDKIDRLVNQVGELVITQAVLKQQSADLAVDRFAGLVHALEELGLQTRELQESVMSVRAQPVKSVFSRMSRLVRELGQSLGKEARLVVTGEQTEVDKTVIEELADPLTHMIRNSMDHGLEAPEERLAAGKSSQGTIHLSAEHRSGRILITVSDDGRGIHREKVLEKARDRGLLAADATLSDEEVDQLIFAPGFSTAAAVSDVSGRGVGMDVVKRKIQDLGGRIGITSNPGRGTRFTLTLPLTLAVLDGMIVRVGSERYIVPITAIVESLRPRPEDVHKLPQGTSVLAIRGTYIPLVFLHRIFSIAGATGDPSQALVVVVETEDGSPIGVVVDDLLGQQQVVIKSLETNYTRVDGVSGATILGNGLVALIIDVDALRALAGEATDRPSRAITIESSEVH